MTGKTHAICGTATMLTIALCNSKGIEFDGYSLLPWISLIAAPLGSYMPDIDLPQSKMGSKHKILSKMLTHRGITHTLLVPAILAVLQYWLMSIPIALLPDLIFGFNVGWLAHIAADMFNKKGVPLFWPLTKKHIHIASVLTRSWQEYVFIPIWFVLNIGAAYLLWVR